MVFDLTDSDSTDLEHEPLFLRSIPSGYQIKDLRLLPGTTRDALLLTTADHRLLFLDPTTPGVAIGIPIGVGIQSLIPVDDRIVAVVTQNGVIALRLPSAASP
ncbi:hypothetical protein ABTZ98_02125 [Streptomyces bacillaris]